MAIRKTLGHPVLILGAGRGGTGLLEMFREVDMVEVVAIADSNPDATGMKLAASFGIPTYADAGEAIQACKDYPDCIVYNLTHDDAIAEQASKVFGNMNVTGGIEAKLTWQMVTNLKRIKNELEASQSQLQAIINSAMDGIITMTEQGEMQGFNPAAEKIFGHSQQEVLGQNVKMLISEPAQSELDDYLSRAIYTGPGCARELTAVRKNGALFPMELSASEMMLLGKRYVVGIIRDVTERKLAEQSDKRLTRAFKLLSTSASTLVHADNEQKLLAEICHLAVETGGYLMAWVGLAENDAAKTVRKVAQSDHGEEEYLDGINISWADTERGQGPTGTAIRTGVTVVNQDFQNNPQLARWREAAIKRGCHSSIALPIVVDRRVIGALNIYSTEPYTFGNEEVQLLERLADDLSYGIQTLRTRVEHEAALIALKRESEKNLALLHNASDGIHILDTDGNIMEVSDSFCSMLGYRRDEVIGMNVSKLDAKIPYAELSKNIKQRIAQKIRSQFETSHRRKDGTIVDVEISSFPLELNGKPALFSSSRDISERKKSEELMRYHTLMINSARDGFWVVDLKGNVLEANQAYANLSGYSVDELLNMHVTQLDALHNDQAVQARINQILAKGYDLFETQHRHKDGHWYDVEVSVNYMAESKQFFAFIRDITKRKQAEIALREKDHLLTESQRIAHVGSWHLDLMTGQTSWSSETYRIYDVSPDTFTPTVESLIGLILPDDRPAMRTWIEACVAGKNPTSLEFHIKRHDGTVRILSGFGELRYGTGNSPTHLIGIVQDITERKKAEADLRIAATAFESHEGLMITDADGVILRINKAFTETTGYMAEEIVGQTPRLLKSGRHNAAFYRAMWETIKRTGGWQGEIWDRRKNGEIYPKWLSITAVKGDDGAVTHYVGSHTDITERKVAEDKIEQLAFHDPLTRLPNRQLLLDRLQQALASSGRSGRQGALLFIDLDNFKTLNDTLGHLTGDLLLQQVAERLISCVREGDTVSRLGGDEFVVMLEDLSEHAVEAAAQTEGIGEKILDNLSKPYQLESNEYHCTTSIGATLLSGHHQAIEELLKQADIAMYQAKKAGRNTLRFFDPQMQETINIRAALENDLTKAIENHELHLHYQVQVNSSLRPLGAEALLRWSHPERGLVSPAQFIPLAEETGLILPIGQWVLETACAQLKEWEHGERTRDLALSINVSAREFRHANYVNQVRAIIQRHGINPKLLTLELTESLLLENIEDTISTMGALNEIGVQFALDDFGTGYSSLQYLKRLPLDQLKIDQSFVRDIASDSSDKEIVRTIIAMAQGLNLDVIAEGVETEEQRQLLSSSGCSSYQGYLFGRPVLIEQFEALLKQD